MDNGGKDQPVTNKPPIFVVSGGVGASGEQLVRTALAQFRGVGIPVIIVPHVREVAQLEKAVDRAAEVGGTIVHTLVDVDMRQALTRLARNRNVAAIDAIGRLLSHLSSVLGQEPAGQPGLYRQLRQAYFDRVEAIEVTMAHDDGKNTQGWSQAEDRAGRRVASGQDPAQYVPGRAGLEGGQCAAGAGYAARAKTVRAGPAAGGRVSY